MPVEPNRPFRWDLVRPDQLGTLLDGTSEPDLWFLQDLVACAAKVLARCADGEVYFVGRSVDSVYDLLSGALTETTWRKRLHQLPLSLGGLGGWFGDLDHAETAQLRTNLTASGLAPSQLAQGRGPVVFVDIVDTGATFENLYRQLRGWATDERAAWDVIRRKLHFLGITRRRHTSPNTWRWQQHADWIADLPARAVRNISLDSGAFSYFADRQVKLTPSFARWYWSDAQVGSPNHTTATRQALAEAVGVVEAGRGQATRNRLVQHIVVEPTINEPWLRALVHQLR